MWHQQVLPIGTAEPAQDMTAIPALDLQVVVRVLVVVSIFDGVGRHILLVPLAGGAPEPEQVGCGPVLHQRGERAGSLGARRRQLVLQQQQGRGAAPE